MLEGRDHTSGDSSIMTGEGASRGPDIYVAVGPGPLSPADQDFIAHARQDIPRLVEAIRSLKS